MNTLYPFKFKPIFKDKIWGGQQIKTRLGMDVGNLPNCGEVWVVSGYEGFVSVIENGVFKGNELNEMVEVFMGDLVGDSIYDEFGDEFPLLIKFIDAADWLSVQVHPDDELAEKRGIGKGKTEMWYILDAEPGAELISGFNRELDKETYQQKFTSGELKSILNYEKVEKGNVFFMPAGRVHAIGPGILLAEIQQTSDNTYRIYDWDRIDISGMSRELHTEQALDAIDYTFKKDTKTEFKELANKTSPVIDDEKFTTNIISFNEPISKDFEELDSFVIYICIEGKVKLEWDEGNLEMIPGDAVVKPAILRNITLWPNVASKLLEVYIKPTD
jgi:mannose-6-phosphate isomerase